MALITASEVNTLAFVNQLDPALILPQFIESAQTKYIVPVVTQDVLDLIDATPGDYTTLVDDYIKPYLAFSVKYMFYNQLLTETQLFPTSDSQREDAIREIQEICSIKLDMLKDYLNENFFAAPAVTAVTRISGFSISSADRVSNAASSVTVVTGVLGSASADNLSEEDSFNFIKYTASALRRITWTNFKAALRTYFNTLYAAITHNHDSAYASAAHNHDASYSPAGHNHDSAYSALGHNHDSNYAALSHSHGAAYASLEHNHDATYSPLNHAHDDAYAAQSHDHDEVYLKPADEADPVFSASEAALFQPGDKERLDYAITTELDIPVTEYLDNRLMSVTDLQPAGDVDGWWQCVACSRDGQKIIAGTRGQYLGRLYISLDGGTTWSETQPAGNTEIMWSGVDIDHLGNTFLAAGLDNRLYKSTNDGATWTELRPAGNVNKSWYFIHCDSTATYVIAGAVYGRTYVSADGGATWSDAQPDGNQNGMWMFGAISGNGQYMLSVTTYGNQKVMFSGDYGANWIDLFSYIGEENIAYSCCAINSDGSVIVLGSGNYTFASFDFGSSFEGMYEFWSTAMALSSDGTQIAAYTDPGDSNYHLSTAKFSYRANWLHHNIPYINQCLGMAITDDGHDIFLCNWGGRLVKVHFSEFSVAGTPASDSDKIDGKHIAVCTQAQYDALTPDANTLYFING